MLQHQYLEFAILLHVGVPDFVEANYPPRPPGITTSLVVDLVKNMNRFAIHVPGMVLVPTRGTNS